MNMLVTHFKRCKNNHLDVIYSCTTFPLTDFYERFLRNIAIKLNNNNIATRFDHS